MQTPRWLTILKALGLVSTIDGDLFCRCARKIAAGYACSDGADPTEVVRKAVMLIRHMLENISRFYSTSFCTEISQIK